MSYKPKIGDRGQLRHQTNCHHIPPPLPSAASTLQTFPSCWKEIVIKQHAILFCEKFHQRLIVCLENWGQLCCCWCWGGTRRMGMLRQRRVSFRFPPHPGHLEDTSHNPLLIAILISYLYISFIRVPQFCHQYYFGIMSHYPSS